jgi:hypothetical protein
MKPDAIRAKFGMNFVADELTFVMGIDKRFDAKIAERFRTAGFSRRARVVASPPSNSPVWPHM